MVTCNLSSARPNSQHFSSDRVTSPSRQQRSFRGAVPKKGLKSFNNMSWAAHAPTARHGERQARSGAWEAQVPWLLSCPPRSAPFFRLPARSWTQINEATHRHLRLVRFALKHAADLRPKCTWRGRPRAAGSSARASKVDSRDANEPSPATGAAGCRPGRTVSSEWQAGRKSPAVRSSKVFMPDRTSVRRAPRPLLRKRCPPAPRPRARTHYDPATASCQESALPGRRSGSQ